jgi:hypothetical protein
VPPFTLTSLSTAITKARTGLRRVFLITSGFSLHEPREKYPLVCCGQNNTTKIYMTEKYIEYRFRLNKHNDDPPHLLSAFSSLYGVIHKKWSVSSAASLRGLIIKSPPSRFPSRSIYKERDAPFPNCSSTHLTLFSEFPVK